MSMMSIRSRGILRFPKAEDEKYDMSEGRGQIDWIASLRGLSALFVFFSHLTFLPVNGDALFVIGRGGVTCFFLITGYLVIQSRIKRNWKQYAINRLIRMYPVYWVLLVLTCILRYRDVLLVELITNMTLFEEFVGFDAILGGSWMMPIQVVFYFLVTVLGVQVFKPSEELTVTLKRGFMIGSLSAAGAIVVGAVRYIYKIPFPTAFFLLIGMAIFGVYIKILDDAEMVSKARAKRMAPILFIFEVSLAVSAVLSYQNQWIFYMISYNTGISIFFLFKTLNSGKGTLNAFLIEIGKVGFTFFLGADIPISVIDRFIALENLNMWVSCLIRFMAAFIFAKMITFLIERPLLRWGKIFERKLA